MREEFVLNFLYIRLKATNKERVSLAQCSHERMERGLGEMGGESINWSNLDHAYLSMPTYLELCTDGSFLFRTSPSLHFKGTPSSPTPFFFEIHMGKEVIHKIIPTMN